MPVVFDSSFLIPLFDSRYGERGKTDPRLSYLLATLERDKTGVIIPAPALSEVLIRAGEAAPRYLSAINLSSQLRVAPFAERAAVEAAAAHREAIRAGDKKEGSSSWAKVKFDRQIISIAIVEGATAIYSEDDDIRRLAANTAIEFYRLADLPYPPAPPPEPPPRPQPGDLFEELSPEDPSPES